VTPQLVEKETPIFIGGFHAVTAALEKGRSVRCIWLAEGRRDGRVQALRTAAIERGVEVLEAPMAWLDEWLAEVRHQGCVAEITSAKPLPETKLPGLLAARARPWVLALDQIVDPHNLGACLRSAAAARVSAVIAPRKRAASLSPAVRKVAAGAAEQVAFVPVTNLARVLVRLKADGFWVVGLDGSAADSIFAAELPERLVLVAGSEARGLRALTVRHCDAVVTIPMAAATESLNVSVAVGIALFEARRQREQYSG
jgi:23S rRNA (guanosine2251-2'-O)-methyltransferase